MRPLEEERLVYTEPWSWVGMQVGEALNAILGSLECFLLVKACYFRVLSSQ